ncbi:MAG: molybdenum ABC transporter ATP-binding protein [Rhodospirillaceae bacterium TMED8]|nr:molybdenum ABC transporter ATP-binding protein [Magnetovibrio sp.]OUT49640.1 MAG: molybdenum ABC transporter ATP-binding protein [Rhodospirillaceae bacterium TMED8]|tara:strand:+ start:1036 stop:2172 length:1137 start_codon:yes stop_codon:yes gene_type:complete
MNSTPAFDSNILRVKVKKRIGEFDLDVSFMARQGVTALFGRSGSGKTTLINLITGLSVPDWGRIEIDNRILCDTDKHIFLTPEKRSIGFVSQEGDLFPHLTVKGNIEFACRFGKGTGFHIPIKEVIELLDLGFLLGRWPNTLSGGEKQRTAIARALLSHPRILVMDEPLASLDASHKSQILPYIERLRDEFMLPIIYVSHDMEEVVRLADTMVLLDQGKNSATGLVEEIMSRADLRPLTGRHEASSVINVIVSQQDEFFKLTQLSFFGGKLWIPFVDVPLGTETRMRVRARDVLLSLTRPKGTSILNILPATVKEIITGNGPQAELVLDLGALLIASVTKKSISNMKLEPGTKVYAMIKAAAITHRALGLGGLRSRRN